VGQLIYDLGNKQWDIPKLRELLETVLPQKASFDDYEVEHDFAGIGKRIMLLNARQVLGKEQIILVAIEDITERRELAEAQNKLAAIVESAEDAIIGKDLEGIIVSWNNGAETIYGYKAKEVIGKSVSLLMPPSHPDEYKEVLAKIGQGETIKYYETQRRRKDGQIIDVSLTISSFKNKKGEIIGDSIIARDITEKKKLEREAMKAKDDIEAANKELEAFSYSVSHDLRAPLRGIDGWSLALLEDYKDKIDEQGRQYIDLVRSETQIMGRLIDDLLTFSRQNRSEMNQQPLDVTAMSHTIISRLQQQNPAFQADFIIQPGLRALGDAGLIEIALKNLLENAAKFSSKISNAIVELGQVEKEGKKTFFVRDNGVGFDMAYAQKLFGVFRRLHKSSEFPGTGIGLASVQRIINRHGGRIWAEAKVNQGATFFFTLKEAT